MAGSDCFHVVMTVALMVQLASVPSTVVSTRALIQRLRPKTSGTTATLVRVKTAAAWLAMTIEHHERPVAADHGEHPGGRAHDDEAGRHVGGAPADPGPGPVAQAAGHRVGEPAEQAVGRQGEGDGQGPRRPLLHEQGDEHPGDGQVGPRADQADGQSDEAPDPGGVDRLRPLAAGSGGPVAAVGRPAHPPPASSGRRRRAAGAARRRSPTTASTEAPARWAPSIWT